MNSPSDLFNTIDDYLNGVMSAEERLSFEEKIAHDKTLAAQVTEMQAANEAIYYASLAELKETIGQDIKNIKYKSSFDWKKAAYISIASLTIITGTILYFNTSDKENKQSKSESKSQITNADKISTQNNSTVTNKPTDIKPTAEYVEHIQQNTNDTIHVDYIPTQVKESRVEESRHATAENKAVPNETNHEVLKTGPTPVTDAKTICNKSFTINIEAACKQKENGSIAIATDGAYEYTFQVDNHTSWGSKGFFQHIAPGDYEILVTYAKECSYTKKVTVEEKWCAMNTAYSFNPDYHETWLVQYETGTTGQFTIYDKSGKEIYSSIFGTGNEYWDGADIHGGTAPVGIYVGIIKYADGRQEKVELTIVR